MFMIACFFLLSTKFCENTCVYLTGTSALSPGGRGHISVCVFGGCQLFRVRCFTVGVAVWMYVWLLWFLENRRVVPSPGADVAVCVCVCVISFLFILDYWYMVFNGC